MLNRRACVASVDDARRIDDVLCMSNVQILILHLLTIYTTLEDILQNKKHDADVYRMYATLRMWTMHGQCIEARTE